MSVKVNDLDMRQPRNEAARLAAGLRYLAVTGAGWSAIRDQAERIRDLADAVGKAASSERAVNALRNDTTHIGDIS